jgi:carbon monoxide dehydrogenase subunit G
MPYEATVPVHRRLLWPAVTDPERLLGALPHVTVDASGAQGVAGRLRVRTREQTITFRGVARIVEVVPAALRVSIEVEAVFGRAGGTVEGLIEIALRKSGSGTRVVVDSQLDIAPGAASLPAESLEAAFRRVVQRWFTVLAETSPAARPERADDQSAPEPARAPERASLAVVRDVARDVPATVEEPAAPASAPVPPSAPSTPLVPTPLRLVSPRSDNASDASSADSHEPMPTPESGDDGSEPQPDFESALELDGAAEPELDDIWSKLRDRSLPPWIPFLVGAASATLAALAVLFAALRRHRRRVPEE